MCFITSECFLNYRYEKLDSIAENNTTLYNAGIDR